ncbi:N-acetyltransferase [Corynebacterium sp. zg-331]|uniref:GNAT family N-acetyltransferase n=1 Tax=unclassified Corynebacterium TaxID=2624378 RepID=UPI00128DB328|nr:MULTISPECIES: GNAT family N-acetyltransferase [unclassified Corynebacterium]MBC3186965.1 N-acetyltransferase [Corynebacterium sp. zg-331]MPV53442.1 GNAT family N-acetyltransferase [Corynebacterium sp. zg331]
MDTSITHDVPHRRYVLLAGGQEAGYAAYIPREDGVLDFHHTVVHESFRGRGLSTVLVRGALDDVRAGGGRIAATCSAVRYVLDCHPEYGTLEA